MLLIRYGSPKRIVGMNHPSPRGELAQSYIVEINEINGIVKLT